MESPIPASTSSSRRNAEFGALLQQLGVWDPSYQLIRGPPPPKYDFRTWTMTRLGEILILLGVPHVEQIGRWDRTWLLGQFLAHDAPFVTQILSQNS